MNHARMKIAATLVLFSAVFSAYGANTWPVKSWASGSRDTRITQALINAQDGDILQLQNDVTVNSDIEIRKRITITSASRRLKSQVT